MGSAVTQLGNTVAIPRARGPIVPGRTRWIDRLLAAARREPIEVCDPPNHGHAYMALSELDRFRDEQNHLEFPEGYDLRKVDLSQRRLWSVGMVRVNLSHANLSGSNLIGADLAEAQARGANLKQTVMAEAHAPGAHFEEADLTSAVLVGADLTAASFVLARLVKADLNRTSMTLADLTAADMWGCSLRGADLTDATLVRTDLSDADLKNANLSGANLIGANLHNADLRGADLTGVVLSTKRETWFGGGWHITPDGDMRDVRWDSTTQWGDFSSTARDLSEPWSSDPADTSMRLTMEPPASADSRFERLGV